VSSVIWHFAFQYFFLKIKHLQISEISIAIFAAYMVLKHRSNNTKLKIQTAGSILKITTTN